MKRSGTHTLSLALAFCVCFCVGSVSRAATLVVERAGGGDYQEIQAAIDDAQAGDTVLVGPDGQPGALLTAIRGQGASLLPLAGDGLAARQSIRVNSVTRSQRSASRAYQPTTNSKTILCAKLE